jgi:hypothetical protein
MLRTSLALAVTAAVAAALATTASAQSNPRLTVSPSSADTAERVTIRGRNWPVIEFCERRVRLSLRSAQNRVKLGTVRVKANRRFVKRFKPSSVGVGAGDWRVVAVLRCESGKDGSPNPIRRSRPLTIA